MPSPGPMLLHRSTHTLPHVQPVWGSAGSSRTLGARAHPEAEGCMLAELWKRAV